MGVGSAAIRAGSAFYEMVGVDNLGPMLVRLQKQVAGFGSFMQRAGAAAAIAGGALSAPLVGLFKGGMDRSAELANLERQLGVNIEILNKFKYAADAAGVSLDEVMQDHTGRYSDLVAKAPPIDAAQARAAAAAQRELKDATLALQNALMPFLQILTPIVKQFTNFVKTNADAIRPLVPLAAGLVGLGVALGLVGTAAGFAATGIGVLGTVLVAAKAVVLTLFSPVGLIIAAGVGLSYALLTLTENGRALGSYLKGGFLDALGTVTSAWSGMAAALGKGDLFLAGQIGAKGLEVVWRQLVVSLTEMWGAFKFRVVDLWHEVVNELDQANYDFVAGFLIVFAKIEAVAKNAFATMASAALSFGITAMEALDKADPTSSLGDSIEWAKKARAAMDASKVDTEAAGAGVGVVTARMKDEAQKKFEEAQRDREDARGEDLIRAQSELDKARAELAELNKEAAKPPPPPEGGPEFPIKPGLLGADAVKGGFSGAALGQQFGYGDQTRKQTELLKQLVDGKGGLPKEMGIEVGKAVVAGLAIRS